MTAEAWITGEPPNQQIHFKLPSGNKGPQGIQGIKGDTGSPDYWTVVDNGRPDVPTTTPYTLAQLNAMPVGVEYRSLDRPQGAYRWLKTGTTGSAAWKCVEGDTGWRAFDNEYLLSGFTSYISSVYHTLRMRRINETIFVGGTLGNIQAGCAGGGLIFQVPQGMGTTQQQVFMIRGMGGASVQPETTVQLTKSEIRVSHPTQVASNLMGVSILGIPSPAVPEWPLSLTGTPIN